MTLVLSLSYLRPGDHVFWKRVKGYDHHAIVEKTDQKKGQVHVIEYDGDSKNKSAASIRKSIVNGVSGMYKYLHDRCYDGSTVVRRAVSRIGERGYNLIFNNCEHFASWCKTGKEKCSQLRPYVARSSLAAPRGLAATAVGRYAALKTTGLSTGFRHIAKEGWKQVGKNGLKTACKAAVVGVTSAVVEGGFFLYNCYKTHQAYKEGMRKATSEVERDYCRKERSRKMKQDGCESAGVVAGATVGSLLGSFVPFVGTAIGAAIGSVVGGWLGRVFGRWLF